MFTNFRAMLLKRKVKQKKVVVKETEWLEKTVDFSVQEKKEEKIVFTARLSEKEKKGKWYCRNNVKNPMQSISNSMQRFINFRTPSGTSDLANMDSSCTRMTAPSTI